MAAIERTRLTKVLIAYLIASFVGLLTFAPWLFVIITNFGKAQMTLDWVNRKIPWSILVTYWGINISRIFLDLTPNYRLEPDFISFCNPFSTALIITLLILVGYSIYFIIFSTQKSVWLFVLTLIGVIALSLALPDLFFGGIRSNNVRYLIASYVGIHLSIAYLLATKIESNHTEFWRKRMWQITIIFIILCGTISCVVSSQADTWWNKYYGSNLPQIARILNRSTHPILMFDSEFASQVHVEPISYILDSKVKLKILNAGNIDQIPEGFSDVFFLNLSKNLQDKIESNHLFKIEQIYNKELSLWKLEKQ